MRGINILNSVKVPTKIGKTGVQLPAPPPQEHLLTWCSFDGGDMGSITSECRRQLARHANPLRVAKL